jgi:hypothetical protein
MEPCEHTNLGSNSTNNNREIFFYNKYLTSTLIIQMY